MSRRPSKQQKPRPRVKFPKSVVSPPPEKTLTKPAVKGKISAPTWENIVLKYLSKLRGFLRPAHQTCKTVATNRNHPVAGPKETSVQSFQRAQADPRRDNVKKSAKLMEPDPDKYSSNCQEILKRRRSAVACSSAASEAGTSSSSIRAARKSKAAKIVSAAIDYGCATGIIRNSGKYFWFRNTFKKVTKSPTPGPRALRKIRSQGNSSLRRPCSCVSNASSISMCSSATRILREKQKKLMKTRRTAPKGIKTVQSKKTQQKYTRCLRSQVNQNKRNSPNKYNVRRAKRRRRM